MTEALIVELARDRMTGPILPGSAIVCWQGDDGGPRVGAHGLVDIWYEGNAHGVENLGTYHEKIVCAAGRMAVNYPTIAKGAVDPAALTVLAAFDLRRNFVVRIIDEPGWRSMQELGKELRPAPPAPAADITAFDEIYREMEKVGYRPPPLVTNPAKLPHAYQLRDGRIMFMPSREDVRLFWPNDPRIMELRSLMSPVSYGRIEPVLE